MTVSTTPADRLTTALRAPKHRGCPALMPYLTSGYPTMEGFAALVESVSEVADAMEIGVPFTDPMADGVTIQGSSRVALENGVSLKWILETLRGVEAKAPMVLMSYLNPLLVLGASRPLQQEDLGDGSLQVRRCCVAGCHDSRACRASATRGWRRSRRGGAAAVADSVRGHCDQTQHCGQASR